ncbi:hypothetical protein LUZ60_017431 [Juncus effusus]|nr:hypothetical protein LUZ60_017431 [Juncus effusus]
MDAYTYVYEMWKKKQSAVMWFIRRVKCWEYRQHPSIVRVTRPTHSDKARRLSYKAKQGRDAQRDPQRPARELDLQGRCGLISAGKKGCGLRGKGTRNRKARPSKRATWKRNQTMSLRRYR